MKALLSGDGRAEKGKGRDHREGEARLRAFSNRWLSRFLQRKPTYYPYLKDWQAMMARSGTAKEAERVATAFPGSGGQRVS
jgi:hypothetical protein